MKYRKQLVFMALLVAAVAAVWQIFGGESAGAIMATGVMVSADTMVEMKSLLIQSRDNLTQFSKALSAVEKQTQANTTQLDGLRKNMARGFGARVKGPHDAVSEECARSIAALVLLDADAFGGLKNFGESKREALVNLSRDILGVTGKAALTSSDIPLPVGYSGEIVELVSEWGAARRYGTVFPLGSSSTKLPRLKTDPTFGLIAASGAVPEKSPQTEWVTFDPQKFGGLIRLPSEIDADSIVALGQFIARYCARQLAYLEDYNFFASTGAGSGINGSVAGLTASTITNGKVVQMASTKTKYSDATLANIRAIRAVPDAPVLQRGAYYMHPSFEQHLSGLNTAGDRPYNPQAQIQGVGASGFGNIGPTLDGFPIRWVDVMPAYSTSANVSKVFMLFGDLSFQYLGVRQGVTIETSREVFFATDELAVRGLERFTLGLMATGAVAGLQTAAS